LELTTDVSLQHTDPGHDEVLLMFGSMNRPETDCDRNLPAQIRRGSNVQNTTKLTRTFLDYQDAKVAGADDMIGKVKTSTIVANGQPSDLLSYPRS
jgi:hypothetical protein